MGGSNKKRVDLCKRGFVVKELLMGIRALGKLVLWELCPHGG